jgi:hypothetical protein
MYFFDEFFNVSLLSGCFHCLTPFRYYKEFKNYEREVRVLGLGLWAAKGETLQIPSKIPGRIIGNKKSKIYYLPDQAGHGRIKEENRVYFDTEEAIKAGYRRAK